MLAGQRTLGEGIIIQVDKKSATIQGGRLGKVLVNIDALHINYPKREMRDIFKLKDVVCFTASKQENDYIATSVVKKSELITVEGKIADTSEKYCYVDCSKKFGKVFVPYSARNSGEKSFMGRGVEKGKEVELKIFRQAQPMNQCYYIAYGIQFPNEKNIESIENIKIGVQTGVIIHMVSHEDILIYSPISGVSRLDYGEKQDWMYLGKFVNYKVECCFACPIYNLKVNWIASECQPANIDYPIIEDYNDDTILHLRVPAVVNRVYKQQRCAWLWNDHIGRIYVSGGSFTLDLKPMEIVNVHVLFLGSYEEVPWKTLELKYNITDIDKSSITQLLNTNDDWVVTRVQENQSNKYYAFLNHSTVGTAFAAWTDFNELDSETNLKTEDKCRVTYYSQLRERKFVCRAVLVTPLEEVSKIPHIHPIIQSHNHVKEVPEISEHIPIYNNDEITPQVSECKSLFRDRPLEYEDSLFLSDSLSQMTITDQFSKNVNFLENFGLSSPNYLWEVTSPLATANVPTETKETQTDATLESAILQDLLDHFVDIGEVAQRKPQLLKNIIKLNRTLW